MDKQFFQDFLMLSQAHTITTLAMLCVVFYALKKMRDIKINFSLRMLFALLMGLGFGFALQYFGKFFQMLKKQVIFFGIAKQNIGLHL